MPIFQDPDDQDSFHEPWSPNCICGNDSPGSIPKTAARTEDMSDETMSGMSPEDTKMDSSDPPRLETSDREELIWRIKRGESPTWVPNRSLGEYFANHSDPPQARKQKTPPLLPAADIREPSKDISSGMSVESVPHIERPRSALHSGDFREGSPQNPEQQQQGVHFEREQNHPAFCSSPTSPWYTPTILPPLKTFQEGNATLFTGSQSAEALRRSRAPSFSSFSSSNFVLKAPTSPLVHEANNSDLDFSPKLDVIDLSASPGKSNRRRTLPPETFRSMQCPSPSHLRGINFAKPSGSWRREGTLPYQAHPSHNRSLTATYSLQYASSCQTGSTLRARRPSYSSDVSPLHHASMVGSYEESILRGRMSTSPSKPLDFTAQIGVLGRGNCKSNLKCPPHVTVPFPAVFYSYATSGSGRSISDDSPSPYVGLIDLENSLPAEDRVSHRYRRRHTSPLNNCDLHHEEFSGPPRVIINAQQERRKREKRSRRSQSPKSPTGGSYRIPQQGQLQIIIKNPNKTAVKLFLVPYDLDGMEPGTKTFIRQRSYSAGPVIDMPLTARIAPATKCPETSINTSGTPEAKPTLRYLIHLNICCPSKGRYYLHSGIRVVFANRVPDGKEQLRNEIQYPEPRYSPYKITRDGALGSVGAKLAAEKAFRRRSSGFGLGSRASIEADGFVLDETPSYRYHSQAPALPLSMPMTFQLFPRSVTGISPASNLSNIEMDFNLSPPKRWSEPSIPDPDNSKSNADIYNKLSRGDIGYGGNLFGVSPNGSEAGESLLARKLRCLDVMKWESQELE